MARGTSAGFFWAFFAIVAAHADRAADFKSLVAEYEAADAAYQAAEYPEDRTTSEKIRDLEAWPAWRYLPRFLALAEAQPDDETAYKCCWWIFDRTSSVGNTDKPIYPVEQRAWEIIAAHHARSADDERFQQLCFGAVQYLGAAQERFLRGLRENEKLPRDRRAIATLALAELLAQKIDSAGLRERVKPADDFAQYLVDQWSPDWGQDLTAENAPKFKAESTALFRELLEQDADVPITISAPNFRALNSIADKARKSLPALEHLTIGAEAPNIIGKDLSGESLELADFRGRVVVLTFWETGCGPCLAMAPQERALIDKFAGRPFALLSVCGDGDIEQARATAQEHGIDWPSWFDGLNGQIVTDYNVLGWPEIYVLDDRGVIVAKGLRGKTLDAKVAELMGP